MTDRIVTAPQTCSGEPAIHGKRITVKDIPINVGGGNTAERVVQVYLDRLREVVDTARQYAAQPVAEE